MAYRRALQTSYNLYPDSTAAVVNLAQLALQQDDLLKAETLLQSAGDGGYAENARAILYMKRRQWDEAEAALSRAEQRGFNVMLNRSVLEGLKAQDAE